MFAEQTSALAAEIEMGSATACPAKPSRSGVPVAIIGVPPVILGMCPARTPDTACETPPFPNRGKRLILRRQERAGLPIYLLRKWWPRRMPVPLKLSGIKRNQAESSVPVKKIPSLFHLKNHRFIGQICKKVAAPPAIKTLKKRANFMQNSRQPVFEQRC